MVDNHPVEGTLEGGILAELHTTISSHQTERMKKFDFSSFTYVLHTWLAHEKCFSSHFRTTQQLGHMGTSMLKTGGEAKNQHGVKAIPYCGGGAPTGGPPWL